MGLRDMLEASDESAAFWTSIVFGFIALLVFIGAAGLAFRSVVWQFHPGWSWVVATAALLVLAVPIFTARRLRRAEPQSRRSAALAVLYTLAGASLPLIAFFAFYGDPAT
ncbi:hypothetical protein BH09ACT4_BH09ACT4_18430 [soil metagenome]